jgi:hypothetical protein
MKRLGVVTPTWSGGKLKRTDWIEHERTKMETKRGRTKTRKEIAEKQGGSQRGRGGKD